MEPVINKLLLKYQRSSASKLYVVQDLHFHVQMSYHDTDLPIPKVLSTNKITSLIQDHRDSSSYIEMLPELFSARY